MNIGKVNHKKHQISSHQKAKLINFPCLREKRENKFQRSTSKGTEDVKARLTLHL